MKQLLPKLFIILLFINLQEASAQTPYAAEISYRNVAPNRYAIQLEVFRQCSSTPPVNQLNINYQSTTCAINNSITLQQRSVIDITSTCPTGGNLCATGQGLIHCIYSDTLNLMQCSDWIFSYSECCRDSNTTNIQSPDTTAIYTQTTLDNSTQENSSVLFTGNGYHPSCIGSQIFYPPHAYDIDGDSLSFSLIAALGTDGNPLTYTPGFASMHNGPDPIYINPYTGEIIHTPTMLTKPVFAIQVDEFRNGVLIASSYKDITFSIHNCLNSSNPFLGFIALNSNQTEIKNVQGGYIKGNIFYVDHPFQLSFDLPIIDTQDSLQISSDITAIGGNYTLISSTYNSPNPIDTTLTHFTWLRSPPALQEFTVTATDNYCDTLPAGGFRIGYAIQSIDCMPQTLQTSICSDSTIHFCPTCQSGTLLPIDTILPLNVSINGTLSINSNQCVQYTASNNAPVQDSFWLFFGGNGGAWIDSMWVDVTTISCFLGQKSNITTTNVKEEIRIYPNPTGGTLNINANYPIQSITLYNNTGRLIKSIETNQNTENLHLGNLEKGMYIIKIQTSQGVFAKKIQYF